MHIKTNRFSLLLITVVSSIYIPSTLAADAKAGADSFAANCAVCHSLATPVKNKVGPDLVGIVESAAGKVANFQYSPAMKAANLVWTRGNLDKYLTNPTALVPGNKMPFKGLSSVQERADLIEFLAQKK